MKRLLSALFVLTLVFSNVMIITTPDKVEDDVGGYVKK